MPVKVLLVDDQPSRRLTYRAVLEPLGEELFEASSGEDALRLLMQHEFAVILLDVHMPGMDGFETASLIHQHPRFEKTPIIFVTAVNVDDMDRLRGYKLGAVDYVMVPVIPEILRSKVMVLCELARKRRDLERANAALAEANETLQLEKARELERLNASLQAANTALGERNADLQAEVEERLRIEGRLRDADRRKDEFLATLAHELRNPLAPIQNALMVRKFNDDRRDDPLQPMMERQTRQLVRLIDDLLDVARVSQGKINLQRRPTTLRDILLPAVEAARPLLEDHGHTLVLDLPEDNPVFLADPERLTQVFSNLLNNAAKYSETPGRIEMRGAIVGDHIEASVRDQGIGLAPDEIEHIFELFTQLDRATTHAQGGLGLGLTLVRELISLHGGQVTVESEGPGKGSTFHVSLPYIPASDRGADPFFERGSDPRLEEESLPQRVDAAPGLGDDAGEVANAHGTEGAEQPSPAVSRTPADHAPVTPKSVRNRVLVVDDNRDAADSLAMMIRMLGHEARAMYDPREVAALIAEYMPSILFLDIGMPELDGRALATLLRGLPEGAGLTLVAVSGWGQPADIQASLDAGFDRHLVKPPSPDAIRDICNTEKR